MSPRVSRAKSKSQTPVQDTTLLASIALPSCSSIHGNLTWSALGQTLVVTDETLFVLSPLIGLHPKLATPSRLCDVETHPDWQGCFPHASCQIPIKTILEQDSVVRKRQALEADYSDCHPLFASARWKSASWSRPGMGPNGSCLILAVTSEMDLYVIGAPSNAWTGDWKLFHSVNLGEVGDMIAPDGHQAVAASADLGQEKMMFSSSRNVIRKQQRATEIVCAAWVNALPQSQDQSQDNGSGDLTLPSSTWIVAGLRAGYAAVLKCQAGTGHCTLTSLALLSHWALDRLSIKALERSSQLAFQSADGMFLCPLSVDGGHCAVLTPSQLPLLPSEPLSAWKWMQHRLVIATVGKVHVYDSLNGNNATYYLGTAPGLQSDPYAAAVSIHEDERTDGCIVSLQDLHEYFVPFSSSSVGQRDCVTLIPTAPPQAKGYAPLLESLQRKFDSLQKCHASEPEYCSTSYPGHTHLLGVTLMDERAAAFGFNVSETSKYQLLLKHRDDQSTPSLLSDALRMVVAGIRHHQPPVAALGACISAFHSSSNATAMARQMAEYIHQTYILLSMQRRTTDNVGSSNPHALLAQEQALFVLTLWLRRQPKARIAVDELRPENHRGTVVTSLLARWLPILATIYSQEPSDSNRRTLLRLSAAVRLLPPSMSASGVEEARRAALAVIGEPSQAWTEATNDGSCCIITQERCSACSSALSLTWSENSHSFEYAVCKNSHIWPRCSITLAAITDPEVRACTTCWVKSLVPGAEGQSASERVMLEAATRCSYCGSCWIVT